MAFSLVHISDFHFRNTYPSKSRLNFLKDDILENTQAKPFYLAFTGDLTHSGDSNHYESLFDDFFVPLSEHARGIYLAPGNHDIQRDDTDPTRCDSLLLDRDLTYLYDALGSLDLRNPFLPTDPLTNYFVLQDTISSWRHSNFYGSVAIEPLFSVVSLNSTWLSYKRTAERSDRGNLRIDPPTFRHFIDLLPRDRLSICMMHHPLDWLDSASRQSIENLLTCNFDLALFGHNHVPALLSGNFTAGSCLFLHAPAILSPPSDRPNAYAIINIEPSEKKYEVLYRTYAPHRNIFVPGVDFAPDGRRYPTDADERYWHNARNRTSSGLMERFTDATGIDYCEWYDTHLIPKSKSRHRLIEARVAKVTVDSAEPGHTGLQRLCAALGPGVNRQFVVGPQDSGLTSAAFLFLKHVAEATDSYRAVPIYINLEALQVNKATIVREAAKMSLVPYSRREIEVLANDGAILFIFDQIGLPEVKKVRSVIDALDRYFPNCQSVFFCAVDGGLLNDSTGDQLPISPSTDVIFELQQFDIDEIGELIRSQRPDAPEAEQQRILARVVSSFRKMTEPVFPSAVSLLVETLRQSPEFRPINLTRLIDRYVECLLGRLSWEDVEEGTFNSNDKVTLLAYVAGRFAVNSWSTITTDTWKQITREYANDRLLELPLGLLEEFTQKGILIQQGGQVTFRADYLFNYFVAKEMNVNHEIYKFIVEGDGFYRNYRELVVYGELEGVDSLRLLEDTYLKLDDLEGDIIAAYADDGVDLDEEWGETLAEDGTNDEKRRDEAMGEAGSETPSKESRSRALSGELRSVPRGRGVFRRFTVQELEARWLVSMRTYCQLVKHCIGLSGVDKLRHFRRCVQSGELLIKHLAARRRELTGNVIHYHGGVVYINPLVKENPEIARKEFKVYAPHAIAEMFAENMVNAQMMPVYRRVATEGSEVSKFIARHLLWEIAGDENRRCFVDSLLQTGQLALQTSSLRQLKYKYLGYSSSPEEQNYYLGIIDDLAGKDGLVGLVEKRRLRQRRMLANMRERVDRGGKAAERRKP